MSSILKFKRNGYTLELDKSQVFEDNPGEGTPAMVYGPNGTHATYWCAVDTGVLMTGCLDVNIPPSILSWLENLEGKVNEFLYP